jgi:hypothetical protein
MATPSEILIRGFDLNNQLVGPGGAWVSEMPQYARRIELRTVGSVTTIYKAWALYGTAESANAWLVVRLILDETSGLDVDEGVAGGSADTFAFSWDARASHSYS